MERNSHESQLDYVRITLTVGLLAGMALTWQLWYSEGRVFPVLPWGFFPRLPPFVELVLFTLVIGSLVVGTFMRRGRAAGTAVALGALAILAAGDQMRWQPWVYQYGLALVPFLWSSQTDRDVSTAMSLNIAAQRLILVATYFWSGIHKFGKGFHEVWTNSVAKPVLEKLDGPAHELVSGLSHTVAPMEIAIAAALVFSPTRRIGVIMACMTHVTILVLIGPLFGNRNVVIWPWNLCMIVLVVVLFWPKQSIQFKPAWRTSHIASKATCIAIFGLVAIMPVLSTARLWDRYLSFHLYSGKQHRCQWAMTATGLAKLPDPYRAFVIQVSPQFSVLDASHWSYKEIKAPLVSEDRVMLAWCKAIAALGFNDHDGFFYHDMPHYIEEKGSAKFRTSEIRKMQKFPPLPGSAAAP